MATMMDGKEVAAKIKADLAERVRWLGGRGVTLGLGTVLVGDDPASHLYVRGKHNDCREVGIASIQVALPASASQTDIERCVEELNTEPSCTGFIVQLPLPEGIETRAVLEKILPHKDADGLHPMTLGRLVLGIPGPLPCTPRAILELLRHYEVPITGAQVCVLGCGLTVGRPLGLMLTSPAEHATVTMCHEATVDVAAHTRVADVVVAATGVANLVRRDWIRPGATVLSVGITRTIEGVLGDVHPEVGEVAGTLAPPVGGVGPMTRAMLLTNIVEMAERSLDGGAG